MPPWTRYWVALFIILITISLLAWVIQASEVDRRTRLHCAIFCRSEDIIVQNGKCGCITFTQLPPLPVAP